MKLDRDQNAAVAVQTNVVVSAGAGSGKTSVLTRRYLRLVVEEHIPVSRILALTFTRKAAAEMYQRIYKQLVASRDDSFVAEQIAEFDSAFISTLDSFCATIARDGCARFGVPPTFSVDEVALRELAMTQAVAFIRRNADQASIQAAVRLLGFKGFADGLVTFAMNHVSAGENNPPTRYLAAQLEYLEKKFADQEQVIAEAFAVIRNLDPNGPKCVQNALVTIEQVEAVEPLLLSAGRYDRSLAPAELARRCDAAAHAVAAAAKIKLTCGSSKHPDVALLKDAVAALRDNAPKYASLLATLGRWAQQEELLSLLDEFYESILAEKQQSGMLSYHDILVLAIRVLESDLTLRAYYKSRFRAIMIDEFQDNNEEQKRLLFLLAEREGSEAPVPTAADLDPSKLFFVGDEKQSIYRFRGADVSVFRLLADDLGGDEAELVLGANYRSEPGLIRFFNSFFAHVFANAESAYEARFLPLRHRDPSAGVRPTVEQWRVAKRPQGDDDFLPDFDAQAYHIASRLRRLVESQTLLVGPDARPAEYRDVAILLKSSSNQIRLERMFRLFGIPYVSGAVRSLFLEAPVNDLYNVLQLAVYPNDRVAYAAYLRSPLVALSDEGIVRQLLALAEGGETAATVETAPRGEQAAGGETAAKSGTARASETHEPGLFDPAAGLSAEDQTRLARGRERYEQIVAAADARPITELLFIMWYEWGYRYHLLRREEYVPYLEYFDLLWELAHSFEQRGLAAFLDEVRSHLGENEKLDELEYLGPEGEGVEIMTVHKSKGLEFPVVVVAYTENAGRSDSVSNAPFYWDDELGPAWNIGYLPEGSVREKPANYLYTAQAEQAALEEAAERKRLLYVAATRAESHLIFCGIAEDRANSFNELISPAFEVAREQVTDDPGITASIIELEAVPAEQEFAGRRSAARQSIGDLALRYGALPLVERRYQRPEIAVSAVNAAYRELTETAGASAAAAEAGEARAPLASDALIDAHELGAEFGTLCHELIEKAPAGGYPQDTAARLAAARASAALGAKLARRTAREQETLLADALSLAESFLGSELWRRATDDVAAGRATVEHELAFLLRVNMRQSQSTAAGTTLARGKIDLLVEYPDRIEIIDFKSDRIVAADHYAMQMFLYQRAAEELFGRTVTVALFDLRGGTLVPVNDVPDEELLQKSIAYAFSV